MPPRERQGGRQQESHGHQSLRATSQVLLRKAEKKPDVLWNEGICDVGHQAKFSSSWFQPNCRRCAKVLVETLSRKPGWRNLLKTHPASTKGSETQKMDILSHDDRNGQAGHGPEEAGLLTASRLCFPVYVRQEQQCVPRSLPPN